MSSKREQYSQLLYEVLVADQELRDKGLPGLELEEIQELRDMIARAERIAASHDPRP